MDGAWSWYPGFGYMFASAYPWGWMPYRYGSWMMVPGMGWMWQPGGWNSWVAAPRYSGALPANFHPLVAPATGTVKTVAVGRGGAVSALAPSRMVLNAGSAGMGIPRGSLSTISITSTVKWPSLDSPKFALRLRSRQLQAGLRQTSVRPIAAVWGLRRRLTPRRLDTHPAVRITELDCLCEKRERAERERGRPLGHPFLLVFAR